MEILIHYISSTIMEILTYVYCTWRWPLMWYLVSCLFMAIILLCIQDCYMYLQLCAELYYCTMLIRWLVFHLGSFITLLLGWTYNVFWPSYGPYDLTHLGASVIADLTTPCESHLYGLPLSLCRLLRPLGPFFVLWCFLNHPYKHVKIHIHDF